MCYRSKEGKDYPASSSAGGEEGIERNDGVRQEFLESYREVGEMNEGKVEIKNIDCNP